MRSVAVGTVVAKSRLPFARVLADSMRQFHPDVPFFVVLADEVEGFFEPADEPFQLVRLDDLAIPNLPRFRFHHLPQELTYAAAPYLLSYLLDRGFQRVAFMKQESLVLGDLTPIFAWLESRSIVLPPHLLRPLTGEDRAARELNILQSGVYNVGFLGVSGTPTARTFLAWFQDRVYAHCRHAVDQGMHFEQRWLDLVPAFFDDVHILREPGFNVGHWNLPEREVQFHGDAILVDGQPCQFFRFSGFDPEHPSAVSRYSTRLTMANVGPSAILFQRYLTLLEAAGYHQAKTWPYAYACFDNGVPIPDLARQLYRELGDAVEPFGDPRQTALPHSYFHWLNGPGDNDRDSTRPVTRLWRAVYDQRPDVRRAFPDLNGADHDAFLSWTAQYGVKEYQVSDHFLLPDREVRS